MLNCFTKEQYIVIRINVKLLCESTLHSSTMSSQSLPNHFNRRLTFQPWYNRTAAKCPVTLYANVPNEYSFQRIRISKLFRPELGKEYKVALSSSSES
ncbi:hypothetical protein CEXT_313291 [Caerostris extrusa]|uniref:Uncharacterized protein n=1 Tax=Caerostris extrusa TaxID=172846 RepID=A0AAV4XRP9_CAEEX|nr:hypothetical protein CEXT_313291 [Caerostris extrusa]